MMAWDLTQITTLTDFFLGNALEGSLYMPGVTHELEMIPSCKLLHAAERGADRVAADSSSVGPFTYTYTIILTCDLSEEYRIYWRPGFLLFCLHGFWNLVQRFSCYDTVSRAPIHEPCGVHP